MSLINWIFDIYQHGRIDNVEKEARAARAEVVAMQATVGATSTPAYLERGLGELALCMKTLQRMMVAKGLCSSVEFAQLLDEVDAEDGKADGQTPL